jgi:voltage-gated potassium channel
MTLPSSAPGDRRLQLLNAYEAKTDLLLSALALVYLVTYSTQMIAYDPEAQWFRWATLFGNFLWLLFVADLVFRIGLSPDRWRFLRTHVLDVVTVAVPEFRALRALRAFNSDGILSKKRGAVTGKAVASAVMTTAFVVWVGSLMVLGAERGAAGAEIKTFGDAIWWSFETITTVGYGDFVPVTSMGRFIATLIMLVGISVLGVVSAGVAATLIKQNPAPPAHTPADDVLKELAELKQMVSDLQRQVSGAGSGTAGHDLAGR